MAENKIVTVFKDKKDTICGTLKLGNFFTNNALKNFARKIKED